MMWLLGLRLCSKWWTGDDKVVVAGLVRYGVGQG